MARIGMVISGLFLLLWFVVIALWLSSYHEYTEWVNGSAIGADGSQSVEYFGSDSGELFYIHIYRQHPRESEREEHGWHEDSSGRAGTADFTPVWPFDGWRKLGFGFFRSQSGPPKSLFNDYARAFTIIIPHWFAALICAFPPVLWVSLGRRRRVRAARLADGCCPNCGYNLAGNTSGTCPECGKTSPWKDAAHPSAESQPRKTPTMLANVALISAAAADLLVIIFFLLIITGSGFAEGVGEFIGAASILLALVGSLVGIVAWNRNRRGRREIIALTCAALFWTIYATNNLWAPLLRHMSHR